ncbi:Versiconal hemiacetal acetate esterase [Fulvia fulva]|uniref:Versiconal hemiacetal acetate esterase n=1 Tax=Passalora fulva TaxID=5499 RepID=A0A9Q8LIC9_PASFU|nr:Versiconal hemiacetal acetate esterase [Fulvia fulva]KAK4624447.1 Versiconal hemiacetal acetate esterase [Fulvia fulva]KAK4625155.1 Versiconal hemiacetal acetate esterase [Fulvia fulva]UJO18186.1 Versiconal hemiacetal acetate esterase [Fulvia fulva]WPV14433.1 Versiconal hemiacetal acetate esterase [Fulvia fulva]WPV30472.1 Versiconal hemiacetal acetate esterase [Fulvia fulva]
MSGGRSVVTGTIEEIRAEFNKFFAAIGTMVPPPENSVSTVDERTAEGVSVRVYTPADLPHSAHTGLYIHCGGWVCGSIDHEHHLARELALDVPCRLVSVDYRLAPEHPLPAALDDCVSAWNWISSAPGFTNSKLSVVGGSAGGHLILTTTLKLLSTANTPRLPTAIFSLCPSVCMLQAYSSIPHSAHTGLYIHCGGWVCGSIDHEHHLARELALDVPCRLVSVDYRLAPEHPLPAALDDCVSAWNWISSAPGFTNSKLSVVGGSAGGHLILTTTLKLLSTANTPRLPTAIFSLCPSVCMLQAYSSIPTELQHFLHPDSIYQDAATINRSTTLTCGAAYIGGSNDPANPLITSIFHEQLKSLPPAYLTTSGKDPLNDEARMLQCERPPGGDDQARHKDLHHEKAMEISYMFTLA